MKKIKYLSAVLLLIAGFHASAALINNPVPSVFADDLDGSGYFSVGGSSFATEILDIGEALAGTGNVFGFFFEGTDVTQASNLISVFDSLDANNDQANINFSGGFVVDVDEAAIQSSFSGIGNIGFYVFLPSFGNQIFFSDASLNPGGADYFGAFESLSTPNTYGLLFADPTTQGQIELVVASSLTAIPNSAAVASAPSIFGLMLMAGSFMFFRRLKK